MSLPSDLLHSLLARPDAGAWDLLRARLDEIWAAPVESPPSNSAIRTREEHLSLLELALSHAAWPLWQAFISSVPRAAIRLRDFWTSHPDGRAVLILDALSLREFPALIAGATAAGLTIHRSECVACELPADTTAFARALGFSSRSVLENNGAGSAHFSAAFTASNGLPWQDAASSVPPSPGVIYWHHWADDALHQCNSTDGGFDAFLKKNCQQLASPEFWQFVKKLATGRRVVITSDHGYAHTGAFPNAGPDEKNDLREKFSAQRFRPGVIITREWLPPLTLTLETPSGPCTFVTGRRKWQVQGGFPLLGHGGLTLMDVFVPWLEISL